MQQPTIQEQEEVEEIQAERASIARERAALRAHRLQVQASRQALEQQLRLRLTPDPTTLATSPSDTFQVCIKCNVHVWRGGLRKGFMRRACGTASIWRNYLNGLAKTVGVCGGERQEGSR